MAFLGSLAHRLFRDLGLKLAAIFLATALYLHVHRESERTATFRLPIDWACARAEPGRGPLPDSASVRIRATAADMERVRRSAVRLRADLCAAETGTLVLRQFSVADLVMPVDVRPLEVVVLEPVAIYARVTGPDDAGR